MAGLGLGVISGVSGAVTAVTVNELKENHMKEADKLLEEVKEKLYLFLDDLKIKDPNLHINKMKEVFFSRQGKQKV